MQNKAIMFLLAAGPFIFFFSGYMAAAWWFGCSKVLVPSVLGTSVVRALELAGQQGVGLMVKSVRVDDTLPDETVVDQLPRPGYALPSHQPLLVTVSRRTAAPLMIDVVGQQCQVLKDFATKHGLHLVQGSIPSDAPPGSCLAQYPLPGVALVGDQVIACIAKQKPGWQVMPYVVGKSVESVCQALAQQQIACSVVHVRPQSSGHSCTACTVSGQRPLGGAVLDTAKPLTVYLLVS